MKKIILGELIINITIVAMLYIIFNFAQPQQIVVVMTSALIAFPVGIAIMAFALNVSKAIIITTATFQAVIAYMATVVILKTSEGAIVIFVAIAVMTVIMIAVMAMAFVEIKITKEKTFAIIKISILAVALIFINYFKS
ncbi:hypothetical protein KKH38_01170 [Patescibacteria group bacterium]|nr:hypothetical protein [Patescibacteria group bacterium]MBU4601164.1 hypothetical protein [Patescibacteria group bacterium]MCG2697895.1 hypothetical protein [Candidatus Parcubacteria bacterium]